MTDKLNLTIENGKYTLIQRENYTMEMLRHGEPWLTNDDLRGSKALLSMGYELEELRSYRAGVLEEVSHAMAETSPSWGHRIAKVLHLLGLDFGSASSTDWAILREAHRTIRWNQEALEAANTDKDWPPLKYNPDPRSPSAPSFYAVVFTPDDNGTIKATTPDIPEVVTYGDTVEDAAKNVVDAAYVMLAGYVQDGRAIPNPTAQGTTYVNLANVIAKL